ncbi:diguanylate cyclase domain-containing protein [Caenispirillum bisanense]|uniref:diguanylate cyclase domain-containing protein n=1 Tax=Caenispirillum bisanense TaxID=414052 RepID=UPI0031D9D7DB
MIHLANILLVMADTEAARTLHAALVAESFAGPLVTSGAEALAQARALRPDVVVVGEHPADMTSLACARTLKDHPETADIPVFLVGADWPAEALPLLQRIGVDDVLSWPSERAVLGPRLRPLVRLSTMRAELEHRTAAAGRFGLAVSDHVDAPAERPQILVAGTEADQAQVRAAAVTDAELTSAATLYEADDLMARRIFDCLVIGVDGSPEPALDICAQIRRNPRLFNLPVILLLPTETPADVERAYLLGASLVLPRQPSAAALEWALATLVRRQQRRWALRRAFDRTRLPALLSADLPELYTRDFLLAYLNGRIETARRQGKPLTVIHFAFGGVARIEEEFGSAAGNHLRQQLGQWITSLVRAEDLAAHLGGARFAVALPDTPLEEAQIVMHRIAGVIGYTDFAVQDVYQVVKVWPHVGAAAWSEADTAASLLEHAEAAAD